MDVSTAAQQLSALAEPTRLAVYRHLVEHAPTGLCVTELLERVHLSQPALSFHLKELANAGLVARRKQGRQVFYSPEFTVMHALMNYLMENCCEGNSCLQTLMKCDSSAAACSPQGECV